MSIFPAVLQLASNPMTSICNAYVCTYTWSCLYVQIHCKAITNWHPSRHNLQLLLLRRCWKGTTKELIPYLLLKSSMFGSWHDTFLSTLCHRFANLDTLQPILSTETLCQNHSRNHRDQVIQILLSLTLVQNTIQLQTHWYVCNLLIAIYSGIFWHRILPH